jgi:glycosyltransferase involved in cell wall biosynthesis
MLEEIKVVINNRNRYTTTKNMVDTLLMLNSEEQIIIIDNGSTYPPLLEWYDGVSDFIDIRYHGNEGHLAVWATGLYKELGSHFIYTDSDIELNNQFPKDWKKTMFDLWVKYNKKVALAIKTDDLPDHYRYKNQAIRNEGRWWLNKIEKDIYQADTDTTFFLIENFGDNQYDSVRIAYQNMICRHSAWYLDLDNLSYEEQYYLNNLGSRVTTQYSKQHLDPEKFTDI